MASGDEGGVWKLFLYPLIILFAIGLLLTTVIKPFTDSGLPTQTYPSPAIDLLKNTAMQGIPFNLTVNIGIGTIDFTAPLQAIYQGVIPNDFRQYTADSINSMTYVVPIIQTPILILIYGCAIFVLIILVTRLIP